MENCVFLDTWLDFSFYFWSFHLLLQLLQIICTFCITFYSYHHSKISTNINVNTKSSEVGTPFFFSSRWLCPIILILLLLDYKSFPQVRHTLKMIYQDYIDCGWHQNCLHFASTEKETIPTIKCIYPKSAIPFYFEIILLWIYSF